MVTARETRESYNNRGNRRGENNELARNYKEIRIEQTK